MRFVSTLIIGCVIAILIAAITAPGDEKFDKFIDNKIDTTTTTSITGGTKPAKIFNIRLFSFHRVTYYKKPERQKPVNTPGNRMTFKKMVVLHSIGTERYLGLFGKFWKLE